MNYNKFFCGAIMASAVIMPYIVSAHDEQARQLQITISALQAQVSSLHSSTPPPTPAICNDGNRYELTSLNSIYESRTRKPTSYIIPNGAIILGVKNLTTGAVNYNTGYVFESNKPSLVTVNGNSATAIITKYNNYDLFIDITVPSLWSCSNVLQPMRVIVGDPFFGTNIAYIYPKSLIPANVLPPPGPWATISVDQMMQSFDVVRITDLVYSLEEKLFGKKPFAGDVSLLALMPPWCGGAGMPTGLGLGCFIQLSNEPYWGVVFHEMGHNASAHFLLTFGDGVGGVYPTHSDIFGFSYPYGLTFSEGIATLGWLYSGYHLINEASSYGISDTIRNSLNNNFSRDIATYSNDLKTYEAQGSPFSTINANILDGMFVALVNDKNINLYGWEIYPRLFKIYLDPLPSFITAPLTELQGHTYFIAGLSAASGFDVRSKFRSWGFPIDDTYYATIYPILKTIVGLPPPIVGDVSPSSGSGNAGSEVYFTTTYADPGGWTQLTYGLLLFNTTINGANAAYAYYNQNSNRLYIRDDANTTWLGACTPGSSAVTQNSYASISCARTTVSGSGATLTIKWALTFKGTFSGAKNIYMFAKNDANVATGWVQKGTWTTFIPPDTTPPSTPTNLTASVQSTSQINLSWTASTDNVGVTGYRVERCQGSTVCTNFVQIATPTTNSYSNSGLTGGTIYRYRVRAGDAAGNLSGYAYVSATTPDTAAPSAPTGLFEDGANYGAGILLAWNPSTDNVGVVRYRIERCAGSTCTNFVQIGTWASNNYSDVEIVGGVTYRYRVRAEDAAGNLSGYSNIINVTAASLYPDTIAPSTPSGLVVEFALVPKPFLAWNASTDNMGITAYRVERCTGATCTNFAQIGTAPARYPTTGQGIEVYEDSTAVSGTTYRWRVRAQDAAGNLSGYSNIVTETPVLVNAAPSFSNMASTLSSIQEQLNQIAATLQSLKQ